MLTEQDRIDAANGFASHERLHALRHALIRDMMDARDAARAEGLDERFAASLRGKAKAYEHAAAMVQHVIKAEGIRPPAWSRARKMLRAFRERREARRAA